MLKKIQKIYPYLLGLGIVLFLINIVGLFIPLKNPDIYKESSGFKDDITLTTTEVFDIINKPVNNKKEYVEKVNEAINKGVLHYWGDKHKKEYSIQIPLRENYVLYIFHHLINYGGNLKYEFCDYKKTIERGVGWCSQVSTALANLLNKKGINTKIITWPEHVVTEVTFSDGEKWLVDPDYGVIVKHSISEITKEPQIIMPYYKQQGYSTKTTSRLAKIFGNKDEKRIIAPKVNNPNSFCWGMRQLQIERLSYVLKWLIPTLLTLPLIITRSRKRKHEK